jgi:hypothetical protein
MRRLLMTAAFAALATFWTSIASAGTLLLSDAVPRLCEDPHILSTIVSRFRHQVHNVPHLPDVEILEFRKIHEHRYLPYIEDKWPIARRYCGAKVDLSDGRSRKIWYLIEDGMGFAGVGDNVEFCVSGFDRWLVYNGRCRILR